MINSYQSGMKASAYYGNYHGSDTLKLPDPIEDPENTLMHSLTSPVKGSGITPKKPLPSPRDSGSFIGGSSSGSGHFKERYEFVSGSRSIPKDCEFPVPLAGEMNHSLGEYPGSFTGEDNDNLGLHPGQPPTKILHSPVKDPGYTPKQSLSSPLKDRANMSKSGSLKNKNSFIFNQSDERENVNNLNANEIVNTSSSALSSTRGFESDSVFNFIHTDGKSIKSFDSAKFKLNKNVLFIL